MKRYLMCLAATLLVAAPALAQDASPLTIRAEKLMDSGATSDQEVRPGDAVRYTLVFTNPRPDPLRNVVFDDPIPQGFVYRPGTAEADRPDAAIAFSIDGGATFSARPTVPVTLPDGTVEQRPAPPERYTHIRWTIPGPVAAGASVTARFDATLDVPEPSRG